MQKQKAFTLLEILLTMALISVLFALSMPIMQTFQFRNEVQTATSIVAQSLRSAQLLARAGKNDSAWGVRLGSGLVTVFRGTSYASRDNSFDLKYQVSNKIAFSGITETYFNKLTGTPNTSGSITIASSYDVIQTLTFNAQGTLTY